MIVHLMYIALIVFFAVCLAGAIWWALRGRWRSYDPWRDAWSQQEPVTDAIAAVPGKAIEGTVIQAAPDVTLDAVLDSADEFLVNMRAETTAFLERIWA